MTREIVVIGADGIEPRHVLWVWTDLVPLGKLTVVAGQPGLGKSLLTAHLAARVSRGVGSGDLTHDPSHVLIATAEDDPADTIVPRLMAQGADLTRVGFLDVRETDVPTGATHPGVIELPGDARRIEEVARRLDARLIILDPIAAFLDAKHSAYRNQDVRHALAPVKDMAERLNCAVVAVMHLNKTPGANALDRIADSHAFTAVARSVLFIGRDPDDPDGEQGALRILAQVKANLAAERSAVTLAVRSKTVTVTNGDMVAPYISVTGTSSATASDVLGDHSDQGRLREAREFLRDVLESGPRAVKEVQAEARGSGIAAKTLERAKQREGVRSLRPGGSGPWLWAMPGDAAAASSRGSSVTTGGGLAQGDDQALPKSYSHDDLASLNDDRDPRTELDRHHGLDPHQDLGSSHRDDSEAPGPRNAIFGWDE